VSHVTVILICSKAQAEPHLTKHLPGARTKQVGHFLAIQHPDLDSMGCDGAEAICEVQNLPVKKVAMREAI
jgi:hypothetical protein